MRLTKCFFVALVGAGLLFTTACKDDDDPDPMEQTLYERLGGTTLVNDPVNAGQMIEQGRLNLRSVVDSTIFVIAGDDRLAPYFQTLLAEVGAGNLSGFTALSKNLTDFFAVATGSETATYTGLNMVNAHDPSVNSRMAFGADDDSFDAFIDDVVEGAAQNGVTDAELVGDLGALIETLRGDVVQRTETLYTRLGGTAMVSDPANAGQMIEQGRLTLRSVVDSTIFVIAGDVRLTPYFTVLLSEVGGGDLSGFTALSKNLTDFLSVAAGATTQTYTGLNMVAAHDPAVNNRMALKSDDAAFDAFIEDVVVGAGQNGVTPQNNGPLLNEIAALLNTVRPAVVQQ